MSVFYADKLIIYSLSFNELMPFNVNADVLAKVRRNYFEHNKRQCDKLVQNINDISLRYAYNLESTKPMKWVVQRDKKILEQALPDNGGGYRITTLDDSGAGLITTYFSPDHKILKAEFELGGKPVTAEVSISGEQAVINYRVGNTAEVLSLLVTDESEETLKRLSRANPFIKVTALTNMGVVYFGTESEIAEITAAIQEINQQIEEEKKPKVYITEQDRQSGFNFKDADFNIRKNMNTTYDLEKAEVFDGEATEDEQPFILEQNNTPSDADDQPEQFPDDTASEEPVKEIPEQTDTQKPDIEVLIDEILKERNSAPKEAPKKSEAPVTQAKEADTKEDTPKEVTMNDPEPEPAEKEPEHRVQNPDAIAPDLIINSSGERYLYFGEVSDELAREGYGRTQMQNGKTAYEGEYHKNKRSGFGSFYFRDGGLCYSGEWKENKRCGFGMGKRASDGSYHVGEWADNKPNGVGARFDKYGRLSYISNFKNGKQTGLCVEYAADGSITIFKWLNDEKKIIQTIYP